jgi:hypothetical protein
MVRLASDQPELAKRRLWRQGWQKDASGVTAGKIFESQNT